MRSSSSTSPSDACSSPAAWPSLELDGQTETEPEIVRAFEDARRITELAGAGEDVDPGSVDAYRDLYAALLDRGPA
jgi:hypothetical protein